MATLIARCGRFRVGSTLHVDLQGTGTTWVTGDPGTPTFEASGATITGQLVVSATTATLTLVVTGPTIVITDPANSTTATLGPVGSAKRWFPGLGR